MSPMVTVTTQKTLNLSSTAVGVKKHPPGVPLWCSQWQRHYLNNQLLDPQDDFITQ